MRSSSSSAGGGTTNKQIKFSRISQQMRRQNFYVKHETVYKSVYVYCAPALREDTFLVSGGCRFFGAKKMHQHRCTYRYCKPHFIFRALRGSYSGTRLSHKLKQGHCFHPVAKESLVSVERVVGIGTSWVAITRDCHLFPNKSLVAEKRTGLV